MNQRGIFQPKNEQKMMAGVFCIKKKDIASLQKNLIKVVN
jgi:hypothetical protein